MPSKGIWNRLTRSPLLPLFIFLATVAQLTALAADDSEGPQLSVRRPLRAATLGSTFHADVNLALVPVTVMDSFGGNVTGLQRENFRVIDGNAPALRSFTGASIQRTLVSW